MAVFNPQIQPTQDPNYLNYSRVLDAPTPDLSGKIGLETAAGSLDSAVNVTDAAIKKGISDKAYLAVDPLRDKMTAGLEQVKSGLNRGIIPKPVQSVAGVTTGKSWLDANAMADYEDNLPVGLEDSLAGVSAMAGAKMAGSPKLNDTKYAGDVLSEARRLRNMYGPGYREYIDQKISEASGLPVANSYYNNMLLDINRQMAQMSRVKDDVGNALMRAQDMPGQADLIDKRKAGDPSASDSEVWHRINDWENLKAKQKIDAAVRLEKTGNKADFAADQEARLVRTLNDTVQINMSALKSASLPGGGTGKDLLQFFDDYANGRLPKVNETELNQRRLQFNQYVANTKQALLATSTGYADVVGGEVARKRVEDAMEPLYTQQKFINSKEDGPAFYITRSIEHIKADATHNFLINKDYGAESRQLLAARAVLGEQYFPQWLIEMSKTGVIDKFTGAVSQENMAAIQPYTDTRGQPIPRYHIDAVQHGKKIGATGDDNYFGVDGVTKSVSKIADPNVNLEAKDRLIDYAFNPKNVGRLEELKMDYRDPTTGKMVPGRYGMFNILASEGINKGVRETSLVHPENYQVYRKTLETEFGRLYRSTLLDLNKAVSQDKTYLGVHFAFNDQTNEFSLVGKDNRPLPDQSRLPAVQYPNARYIEGLQDKLGLINGAVSNLARIQRNDPKGAGDTPTYLLQALQTAGFRPGTNLTGATEGMARAIIKAKNPDMTHEDLTKALLGSQGPGARSNFAPEEDNSLASFLKTPSRNRDIPEARPLASSGGRSIIELNNPELGPSQKELLTRERNFELRRRRDRNELEPYQTRGVIQGNLSDQPIDAPIRTQR